MKEQHASRSGAPETESEVACHRDRGTAAGIDVTLPEADEPRLASNSDDRTAGAGPAPQGEAGFSVKQEQDQTKQQLVDALKKLGEMRARYEKLASEREVFMRDLRAAKMRDEAFLRDEMAEAIRQGRRFNEETIAALRQELKGTQNSLLRRMKSLLRRIVSTVRRS